MEGSRKFRARQKARREIVAGQLVYPSQQQDRR
jgi:hypothetical protein